MRTCKICNSKKYYAKGMCRSCYIKQLIPKRWNKTSDFCKKCGSSKRQHAAKELCNKCYNTKPGDALCACGCKKPVSIYRNKSRRFKKGHWLRTQGSKSPIKKKQKESVTGKNNPNYGKFGKDHPAYGHYVSPEAREERRQRKLKAISKRLTKPTDIEIILSNLLDDLSLEHIPQYLINNKFAIDEFLPKHNLIIEAHGGYWHGDPRQFKKEKLSDLQRSNINRDKVRIAYFRRGKYEVLILWEKELKEKPQWCKDQILSAIKN